MVIIEHKLFLGILSEEKRTPNFSFFTHTNMGGNFSRVDTSQVQKRQTVVRVDYSIPKKKKVKKQLLRRFYFRE